MLDLRSYDDTLWAWEKALDESLERVLFKANKHFYKSDDKTQNILASQWDLPISKGLDELLKEPLKNYFLEGSEYYLNKALSAVYGSAKISQWYEYGGAPYWFKVDLTSFKDGFDLGNLAEIEDIIKKYKNVRSVFAGIDITLENDNYTSYYGINAQVGEVLDVYPARIPDYYFYIGGAVRYGEELEVYPRRIKEPYAYAGACFSVTELISVGQMPKKSHIGAATSMVELISI